MLAFVGVSSYFAASTFVMQGNAKVLKHIGLPRG